MFDTFVEEWDIQKDRGRVIATWRKWLDPARLSFCQVSNKATQKKSWLASLAFAKKWAGGFLIYIIFRDLILRPKLDTRFTCA